MLFGQAILTVLLIAPICSASAATNTAETPEVHEKVQAALDWRLPHNDCQEPRLRGAGTDIVDSEGTTRRYDIDSYKLARFERQQKRWKSCVKKYKQVLLEDFEELKDSAQYGLSQQQANTILGQMALIQSVLESPNAMAGQQSPPTEFQ